MHCVNPERKARCVLHVPALALPCPPVFFWLVQQIRARVAEGRLGRVYAMKQHEANICAGCRGRFLIVSTFVLLLQ